jgi:putative ABC transport system substrate-binding protein
MHRRTFLCELIAVLFTLPLGAEAQQGGKFYRIGVLHLTPDLSRMEAFRHGLSELGYIEGQHVAILDRLAEGKVDRLHELVAELVRLKVDVIVTGGATTTHAAKQATGSIPIVMAADDNPVEDGFIASLGRPGKNITGLTTLARELNGKRLALLKETVPRIARVAVLSNPTNLSSGPGLSRTREAAHSLGLQLETFEVRGPEEFDSTFSAMAKARAQGLVLAHQDALFHVHAQQLASLALKSRLPTVFYVKDFAEQDGLISYAPDYPDLFRRAAVYVDKILKGVRPGDLPVEQPQKFELIVNAKSAHALGLTIPSSLLTRADLIIQ